MKAFRNHFGAIVANGQGEMKGQLFRIAHLGYYDYLDTIAAVGALEQVLAQMGRKVELGAGLRAAQQVYDAPAGNKNWPVTAGEGEISMKIVVAEKVAQGGRHSAFKR